MLLPFCLVKQAALASGSHHPEGELGTRSKADA